MIVRVRDASEPAEKGGLYATYGTRTDGICCLFGFFTKEKKMTGLAVDQELEAVSQPRSKSAESSYASICGLIAPSLFS